MDRSRFRPSDPDAVRARFERIKRRVFQRLERESEDLSLRLRRSPDKPPAAPSVERSPLGVPGRSFNSNPSARNIPRPSVPRVRTRARR
jgi:hypothetical protein